MNIYEKLAKLNEEVDELLKEDLVYYDYKFQFEKKFEKIGISGDMIYQIQIIN